MFLFYLKRPIDDGENFCIKEITDTVLYVGTVHHTVCRYRTSSSRAQQKNGALSLLSAIDFLLPLFFLRFVAQVG